MYVIDQTEYVSTQFIERQQQQPWNTCEWKKCDKRIWFAYKTRKHLCESHFYSELFCLQFYSWTQMVFESTYISYIFCVFFFSSVHSSVLCRFQYPFNIISFDGMWMCARNIIGLQTVASPSIGQYTTGKEEREKKKQLETSAKPNLCHWPIFTGFFSVCLLFFYSRIGKLPNCAIQWRRRT